MTTLPRQVLAALLSLDICLCVSTFALYCYYLLCKLEAEVPSAPALLYIENTSSYVKQHAAAEMHKTQHQCNSNLLSGLVAA